MCFFVQTNHTRKELLFLMFKEINLRNHSSLHKLFYSFLPNFVIHEYNVNTEMPKMLKLTKYDYEPNNGVFTIPNRPGIGNEISDYAFKHSSVVTVK